MWFPLAQFHNARLIPLGQVVNLQPIGNRLADLQAALPR